jgi:four helix bundle protein
LGFWGFGVLGFWVWGKTELMRNFKELEVWKESRVLTKDIYLLTNFLPQDEKFGLISQIRRCVISIASNIAEGAAKDSQKDFLRYLQISLGSSFELESHLILCVDLELISKTQMENHLENIERIQKRISSLIKYVKTQI